MVNSYQGDGGGDSGLVLSHSLFVLLCLGLACPVSFFSE